MVDTVIAPAYFYLLYGTADQIVLGPQDQLEDARLTITEMTVDGMTQASMSPANTFVNGLNVEAQISVANVGNLDLFNKLYQGSDDLTSGDRRLTGVASRPGCEVPKAPALIKLASCDGPTINTDLWFFIPYAGFFTTDTSFTFSKQQQLAYTITLRGFDPPSTSIYFPYKVLRGDIGVISGDPAPTPGGGTGGGGLAAPTGLTAVQNAGDNTTGLGNLVADVADVATATGYEWQLSTDNGSTWGATQTSTTSTYTFTGVAKGLKKYRVRATGTGNPSAYATLGTQFQVFDRRQAGQGGGGTAVASVLHTGTATNFLYYDAISPATGTANDMTLRIGTTDVAAVTFPSEYVGKPFRFFQSSNSTYYNGTFAGGNVTLT